MALIVKARKKSGEYLKSKEEGKLKGLVKGTLKRKGYDSEVRQVG